MCWRDPISKDGSIGLMTVVVREREVCREETILKEGFISKEKYRERDDHPLRNRGLVGRERVQPPDQG